jgi:hypothetical protein
MKFFFVFITATFCLSFVVPALSKGIRHCPAANGRTIASLRLCVGHALTGGLIRSIRLADTLVAKLDTAEAVLARGQSGMAVYLLKGFIREVQAGAGEQIEAEHAGHLVDHAAQVIAALTA